MAEARIRALALGVEFGAHRILDGVSLEVPPGHLLSVIGPNGAGKTTLLRAVAGLVPEATGTLSLGGVDPRTAAPDTLAKFRAYGLQNPAAAWDFSVAELGELGPHPENHAEWLARLEIRELADRRLGQLSGGERKAAFLALTFATLGDPFGKILLLDEPTTGLDLRRQRIVHEAVRGIARSGAACLIATHDREFARGGDALAVLAEGRLIARGEPETTLTPEVRREIWGAD